MIIIHVLVESSSNWSCWKICRILWSRSFSTQHCRSRYNFKYVSRIWRYSWFFPYWSTEFSIFKTDRYINCKKKINHNNNIFKFRFNLWNIFIGRSEEHINKIEKYLTAVHMLRNYDDENQNPNFSEVVTLDLGTVVSSVSGPKRPHDRVSVVDMKIDFKNCLTNKVGIFSNYHNIYNIEYYSIY